MELGVNYFNLFIGIGLGVLITLIIRAVADEYKSKKNMIKEEQELDERIQKSMIKNIQQQHDEIKVIFDRIDQHAGRIEKLESKKR